MNTFNRRRRCRVTVWHVTENYSAQIAQWNDYFTQISSLIYLGYYVVLKTKACAAFRKNVLPLITSAEHRESFESLWNHNRNWKSLDFVLRWGIENSLVRWATTRYYWNKLAVSLVKSSDNFGCIRYLAIKYIVCWSIDIWTLEEG